MGKSLYISRKVEELDIKLGSSKWLRSATLHGPELSRDSVVRVVQSVSTKDTDNLPFIYQVEVSDRVCFAIESNSVTLMPFRHYDFDLVHQSQVVNDIGSILFSMIILRGLQDSEGNIWRCKLKNLYLIEVTVPETGVMTGPNSVKVSAWLPVCKLT